MRIFLFMIVCVTSALFGADVTWMSYSQADRAYAKEKKPWLLFFTSSDHSGLSIRLQKEVLSDPSFQKKIGQQFYCVQVDFPLHQTQSAKETEANEALKSRFGVEQFPMVILLDKEKKLLQRYPSPIVSAQQFADDLFFALALGRDLDLFLKSLAQGELTEENLSKAYALALELGQKAAQRKILQYGSESEQAPYYLTELYRFATQEKEKDLISSLKKRLNSLDDSQVQYKIALIDYQMAAGSKEAAISLEKFLEKHGERAPDLKWQVHMLLAQHYLEFDEVSKALAFAESAKQEAPEEKQEVIAHSLDYIHQLHQLDQVSR